MKWVQQLSTLKVPFYIYKLNKQDCILYESNKNPQKSLIILDGVICIIKIFTNGEKSSTAILSKNHIVNIRTTNNYTKHYYYKAIVIETAYIISFQWKDIIKHDKIPIIILNQFINSYESTIYRYEQMNHIITHKYIKNRIIQLIFFLCQEFGIIKKKRLLFLLKFHKLI